MFFVVYVSSLTHLRFHNCLMAYSQHIVTELRDLICVRWSYLFGRCVFVLNVHTVSVSRILNAPKTPRLPGSNYVNVLPKISYLRFKRVTI